CSSDLSAGSSRAVKKARKEPAPVVFSGACFARLDSVPFSCHDLRRETYPEGESRSRLSARFDAYPKAGKKPWKIFPKEEGDRVKSQNLPLTKGVSAASLWRAEDVKLFPAKDGRCLTGHNASAKMGSGRFNPPDRGSAWGIVLTTCRGSREKGGAVPLNG